LNVVDTSSFITHFYGYAGDVSKRLSRTTRLFEIIVVVDGDEESADTRVSDGYNPVKRYGSSRRKR